MPLVKSDVLDTFLRAWAALEEISLSQDSTPKQVRAAESAQDELTHDFIRERLDSLSERTAAFTEFVELMKKTVSAIGTQGPLGAIKRLKSIIDDATQMIESTQTTDGPGTGNG